MNPLRAGRTESLAKLDFNGAASIGRGFESERSGNLREFEN